MIPEGLSDENSEGKPRLRDPEDVLGRAFGPPEDLLATQPGQVAAWQRDHVLFRQAGEQARGGANSANGDSNSLIAPLPDTSGKKLPPLVDGIYSD